MNLVRNLSILCIVAFLAACSTTPKPSSDIKPSAAPVAAIADISGKWIITVQTPMGAIDSNMSVNQVGSDFKGTLDSSMGSVDYTGSINGMAVKFSYSVEKFGAPAGTIFNYVGTLESGVMKGTATFAGMGEGEWSAKRQ